MRKLYMFNMVSLDGYFEGINHDLSWHHVDHDFDEFSIQQLYTTDTLFFGRTTYEMMATYWPTEAALNDDPIVSKLMTTTKKYVFSKTLPQANWENTTVIRDDIAAQVQAMKQQEGKEIAIFGSNILGVSLIQAGLIDEFRIMVNPVILGSGTPLFKGLDKRINLKLLQSITFDNGNVLHYYKPE
jgi:dihydrofolate reductase